MQKTSGNLYLGHLGGQVFHIFQGCNQSWGDPDTF